MQPREEERRRRGRLGRRSSIFAPERRRRDECAMLEIDVEARGLVALGSRREVKPAGAPHAGTVDPPEVESLEHRAPRKRVVRERAEGAEDERPATARAEARGSRTGRIEEAVGVHDVVVVPGLPEPAKQRGRHGKRSASNAVEQTRCSIGKLLVQPARILRRRLRSRDGYVEARCPGRLRVADERLRGAAVGAAHARHDVEYVHEQAVLVRR